MQVFGCRQTQAMHAHERPASEKRQGIWVQSVKLIAIAMALSLPLAASGQAFAASHDSSKHTSDSKDTGRDAGSYDKGSNDTGSQDSGKHASDSKDTGRDAGSFDKSSNDTGSQDKGSVDPVSIDNNGGNGNDSVDPVVIDQ